MITSSTTITLPHWAFVAIGKSDINSLIDRCEYETIIVTRQGRPDIVMIGHAEWTRLTQCCSKVTKRHEPAQTTQSKSTDNASAD
jgi:prevent-host-death family protein